MGIDRKVSILFNRDLMQEYMIKNQGEVFLENKDIILFPMREASLPHSTCAYCRGYFEAF